MTKSENLIERFAVLLGDFRKLNLTEENRMDEVIGSNWKEDFEQLLRTFEQVPKLGEESRWTLLEIAGVAERELVSSNILAFFLDPREKHRMGDTVLKALLESVGAGQGCDSESFAGVEVRPPEVTTENQKRLDLVITTDSLVVAIENKINASVVNPFKDYSDYLKKQSGRSKKTVKILLSLWPLQSSPTHCGFVVVSYEEFFRKVLELLGPRLLGVDQRSLNYLVDFMTTLQNVKKGTHMDAQLLKFFRENATESYRFYRRTEALLAEIKSKVKPLKEMKWPARAVDRFADCSADAGEFFVWSWCEIGLRNGAKFVLQAGLSLKGWAIQSYVENVEDVNIAKAQIAKVFGAALPSFGKWNNEGKCWEYANFPYEEKPETVKGKFQELLNIFDKRLSI